VEQTEYRRNFVEIIDGCSTAFINHKRVFIQHKKISDVVDYDLVYQNFLDYAINKGMPEQKDVLNEQIEAGEWDPRDDETIEEREHFIKNLKATKSEMVLQSVKDTLQSQIEDAESYVLVLKNKKEAIISNSAERYATNRANDYYITKSFYKDVNQKEPLYTEEEFEFLDDEVLTSMISAYNDFNSRFSEESIQGLAIQDFFKTYYSFSETSSDFYGKPVVALTNFQLHLIIYTKIFKNIFETNKDIPERIKSNPSALMDYAEGKSKRDKVESKLKSNKSGVSSIVGATKEDYADMGVETESGQKTMHQAAKAKGGRLSMKDLMDLNGF
jgi:hypothetical protein